MYLDKWLEIICSFEKPLDKIKAFYFGLFESEAGFTIYLMGSEFIDEPVEDWDLDTSYFPKERYFEISIKKNWDIFLDEVRVNLEGFIQTDLFKNSFFAKAEHIFLGFDDGDLIKIL